MVSTVLFFANPLKNENPPPLFNFDIAWLNANGSGQALTAQSKLLRVVSRKHASFSDAKKRDALEIVSRRYQLINIKLDKTGGLTEALALAGEARNRGLGLMVGNMTGTSLAMAPGLVLAQLCDHVDLDGALWLRGDREHGLHYERGLISGLTPALWG